MKISEMIDYLERAKNIIGDGEVYFKAERDEVYRPISAKLDNVDVGVELSVDEFLKHVFSLKVNDVAKLNIIKRAVDSGKKIFNVNNGKNFKVVAMFDCEGEKSWYYV